MSKMYYIDSALTYVRLKDISWISKNGDICVYVHLINGNYIICYFTTKEAADTMMLDLAIAAEQWG